MQIINSVMTGVFSPVIPYLWSPDLLFQNSEPGAWYDPSDITTLFQDNLGATPVTAAGQTVGKILDKSGRGNHATQATLAQRPTYGVNPIVGTRNILTYSSWSNAVGGSPGTAPTGWTIGFGTGAQTSLVGSLDIYGAQAIRFDADSGERIFYTQTVNVVAGKTYILSVEILAVSGLGNTVVAIVSGTATGTAVNVVNPTSTGRVTATYVCTVSGSVTLRFGLGVTSAAGTSSITFKKPQFELGSTATNYQKVVSQYDVTEIGVQSIGYLSFDGVDDGMVTGTITPGIDKAQVFAGLRKLSDAAQKIVAEMSASIASNAGSFALTAPNSAAANYNFSSKGTTQTDNVVTTYTAPITNIISGLGDIAGASNFIRVNGSQVGSALTTQGTGNYLAYPLYVGRRGGTTLPFNGFLYSLIARFGTNLTSEQITSTESWVNSRTGAY